MALQLEIILRLLLAGVLGAIIGYQRERAKKPAGLRTHILICLGAALCTAVSAYGFLPSADPSRVAAAVIVGIGFVGAGAIIHSGEGYVTGLTTAASIWAVAAVGLAAGAGLYVVAAVAALLILIVLILPHPIR